MEKNNIENKIWERTVSEAVLKYVADNFKVPVSTVNGDCIFGVDLKQKSKPSLSEDVNEDLRSDFVFVLDRKTRKAFESGRLEINSVNELSAQMIRCYQFNKTRVCSVLNISTGKRRKKLCFLRKKFKNGRKRKIFYIIKRFLYS